MPQVGGGGAFLNLQFARPMVCMRDAFHENDDYHESDEDNSDRYKQELSAGFAELTETTEMTKTTGIQGANHGFLTTG